LGEVPILSRIVNSIPHEFPVSVLVTPELRYKFDRWRATYHGDREVHIAVERPRPEGQAGPVAALADWLDERESNEDLLVMMGDSVHPFDWKEFLRMERPDLPLVAALQLPPSEDARRFGVLTFGPDHKLTSFEEKPEHPRSNWIFTGCIYVPAPLTSHVRGIADAGFTQMGHLVSGLFDRHVEVRVHSVLGEWHDIGTFYSYLEAHRSQMCARSIGDLVAMGNRLEGIVYVHPSARVTNSRLSNCVIFGQADVSSASLSDCVIQKNVTIRNRVVRRCVVSRDGDLAVP
jgi:glucose-1-phosphate adenylyltransferase